VETQACKTKSTATNKVLNGRVRRPGETGAGGNATWNSQGKRQRNKGQRLKESKNPLRRLHHVIFEEGDIKDMTDDFAIANLIGTGKGLYAARAVQH